MPSLAYKTRGNSSVQGKGRVYFSCHPEDFDTYFEMVSKDILEKQNCVIWYDKEPESAWDESLATDISHMRLLVIPVTARLLQTENRTMKYEFPYAVEQNIPVLPILMDVSLEKEFNQHFGNLQWLNPYEMDSTAISYDKKLEQYLEEILLGDELRERIRQEFKGYIFFSYRKKDRKYARELMRKIHDWSSCRDLAIWYDEYLVPGENFDESILKAMKKSDIFLLMVTPNLMEEKNYVVDKEYPEARRLGESIVAVEVEKTDRALLLENYEGLSNIVNMESPYEIGLAIDDILYEKGIKKNKETSEHLYYMGLAYLAGVDVEVDSKRAVRLIQLAADAGFVDAMKKLASMYENGEAVIRDETVAVTWKKGVIEELTKEYQRNKNEVIGMDLITEMRKLSYILGQKLMDEASAKEALMQAVDIAKEIHGELGRWNLASLYTEIASYAKDEKERRDLYEKALVIADTLYEKGLRFDYKSLLGTCYSGIASCFEMEGDYDFALQYYEKVLELNELDKNTATAELARLRLAKAYMDVGRCMMQTNDFSRAKEYLFNGFEIMEMLEGEFKHPYIQGNYNLFLITIAQYYEKKADLTQAIQYAKKSEQYTTALVEKEDTVLNVEMNLAAIMYLAELYKEINPDESKVYYDKAKEISKKIQPYKTVEEDGFPQLYACLMKVGEYEAAGDKENTEWYFEQALDIAEKMLFVKDEMKVYYEVAKGAFALGTDYYEAGEYQKSLYFYNRACVLGDKMIQIDRADKYLYFLVETYERLVIVLEHQRKMPEAKAYLEKELELLAFREKGELEKGSACSAEILLDMWEKTIHVCKELADYEAAYEKYEDAMNLLKIAEEKAYLLLEMYRGESTYAKLMNIWYKMYETLKEAGDESGAAFYYKKYDELYEQLYGV